MKLPSIPDWRALAEVRQSNIRDGRDGENVERTFQKINPLFTPFLLVKKERRRRRRKKEIVEINFTNRKQIKIAANLNISFEQRVDQFAQSILFIPATYAIGR